ncbi:MAG: hypothetical protein WCY98_10230 [Castellaniella sp.]
MKKIIVPAFLSLALGLGAPVLADEVSEALKAAQQAYEAGRLNDAAAQITTANKALLSIKKARLAAFLPDAPEGWTRTIKKDDSDDSAGLMGGLMGVGAKASYLGPDEQAFTINLMADSPMVVGMMGMLGNPQMMAMMGKVVTVNGQSMMVRDNSMSAMVGGRVLVQAEGGDEDIMKAALSGIDFATLAAYDG